MSEADLRELLAAENEAQERVRLANEEAESIRKKGLDEAARIEREAGERIEAMRAQMLRDAEREIVGSRERMFEEANAAMEQWEERYRRKHDELLSRVRRAIKQEGP